MQTFPGFWETEDTDQRRLLCPRAPWALTLSSGLPTHPTALFLSEGSGHRFFPTPKFTFSPGKLRGTGTSLQCRSAVLLYVNATHLTVM